jgi:hypothetical protein
MLQRSRKIGESARAQPDHWQSERPITAPRTLAASTADRDCRRCPRGAAKRRLSKLPLKKVRLILIVEADLKPNTASGVRNWFDRDWLDVAVIQPNTDDIHSSAEGIAGLFLDTHDECRIGRHIALLP